MVRRVRVHKVRYVQLNTDAYQTPLLFPNMLYIL